MGEAFSHRLIFLRHGETDWNVERRLQGQHDIPLNDNGREQAARAGKRIRSLQSAFPKLDSLPFLASPLGRTRETMEIARVAMGLDPNAYSTDDRLKELSFGTWEGLTWPEVQAEAPNLAWGRETDKWGFMPPKGESYAMLADRLAPFLESLEGDSVIVSHGGVARVLMAMIGGAPPERAPMADIWQDRPLVFQRGRYDWI
jgi:broad specificity phosphatase PhoE